MTIDPDLLAWQRIRRYAVPLPMIEECTRLREAGDWRGACAAAGVEVTLDEPAEHVRADLLRLAPDLLRGQVPLAPAGLPCQLTADLAVEVPPAGSRRLRLSLRKPTGTFLDLAPWHWDATAADGLAAGDASSPRIAEAQRVAARYGVRTVGELTGNTIDGTAEGPLAWPGPPDPDLLRHKLITPDDLHPLVAVALAPAHRPQRAKLRALLAPVPVRCHGEWHTLVHDGGELRAVAHQPDEEGREATLGALGGPVSGCFLVRQAWTSGGWVPRPLRRLRAAVREHLQCGDTLAVEALLDAGLDLRHRNSGGATLLHLLGLLSTYYQATSQAGRPALHAWLLTRLLDAGMPVDIRDSSGRTPLRAAIDFGTSPQLVRDLLAAGADPKSCDRHGVRPLGVAGMRAERRNFTGTANQIYEVMAQHRGTRTPA